MVCCFSFAFKFTDNPEEVRTKVKTSRVGLRSIENVNIDLHPPNSLLLHLLLFLFMQRSLLTTNSRTSQELICKLRVHICRKTSKQFMQYIWCVMSWTYPLYRQVSVTFLAPLKSESPRGVQVVPPEINHKLPVLPSHVPSRVRHTYSALRPG